jgi:DNA invertase Pin-like site-specific DNA recombinase
MHERSKSRLCPSQLSRAKYWRQLEGIETDRLFIDKASGKNTDRPKFQEMLNYVREGDMVVVHSMDRFARSLKDLVEEVDKLVKRGIAIQFIKEKLPLLRKPRLWIISCCN